MAAGAPLIPEGVLGIAALVDLLIALLDILALGVLLGMLWTYKHSIGALIEFLVKHTTIHTPLGNVPLLFPLAAANNFIMASMSTAALGLEVAGGRFFHALGVIVGWMVNLALYTATTMEHGFSWLRHVHIPKAALWAARVAFPLAWLTKLIAEQVAKAIPHTLKAAKGAAHAADVVIYRYPKAIGRRLTKTEKTLAALAAAIAALGGHVIHPGHTLSLPKSWYGLTKRLARLERRMHRAEGWLAAGALAVAMANVLGVTARCLRSGNVGKVTRKICGLDARALEDLLGLIADALILVNICEVITLMEQGLGLISGPIDDWIATADTMFVHCNYDLPPKLGPIPLSLPPVTGVVLSLP